MPTLKGARRLRHADQIKKAEDDYATKHPVIAVLSALMLPTRREKPASAISRHAKAKSAIINRFCDNFAVLNPSARERSPRWHDDIELHTVDIALWIEA
jgi:hypothetical protein